MRKVRQVIDPVFTAVAAGRAASAERAQLSQTVSGPGRWMLSVQLPLVGVLLLASGTVLSLYGSGFRQGALWLALLGVAHGANSFAGIAESMLMIERPALNLLNSAVTVTAQVMAGLVLIPRTGILGAAVAMLVGFAIQGVLRFVELRHVFGWWWPWSTLKRPALAFTVAFVPAALLRFGAGAAELLAAAVFVSLYLLTWRVLGAEPQDRDVWRRLLGREVLTRAGAADSLR
jgi:O-antigen/teichoic acid export membrane protein